MRKTEERMVFWTAVFVLSATKQTKRCRKDCAINTQRSNFDQLTPVAPLSTSPLPQLNYKLKMNIYVVIRRNDWLGNVIVVYDLLRR